MTNAELIAQAAKKQNFDYTGDNLFTYPEWKKRGYQVKKGEKTFLRVRIWGEVNKKKYSNMTFPKVSFPWVWAKLFTIDQVVPIEAKST